VDARRAGILHASARKPPPKANSGSAKNTEPDRLRSLGGSSFRQRCSCVRGWAFTLTRPSFADCPEELRHDSAVFLRPARLRSAPPSSPLRSLRLRTNDRDLPRDAPGRPLRGNGAVLTDNNPGLRRLIDQVVLQVFLRTNKRAPPPCPHSPAVCVPLSGLGEMARAKPPPRQVPQSPHPTPCHVGGCPPESLN